MRLLLVLLLVLVPFSQASAASFGVTANPLWTNTGMSVLATDTLHFDSATASWTYQPFDGTFGHDPFGPEGVPVVGSDFIDDEWIQNGLHGQLIGFIGSAALDLNAVPRAIAQNASGLFAIGAGPQTVTGLAGNLWLGFNDGYITGISNNDGTGSVNVSRSSDLAPVPEPATLLLFGTTAGGLALARWRKRKQDRQ